MGGAGWKLEHRVRESRRMFETGNKEVECHLGDVKLWTRHTSFGLLCMLS